MLEEFLSAINGFTDDELRLINETVVNQMKFRRDRSALTLRQSLKVGDQVSWNGGPRRGLQEGEVVKINRKKAICSSSMGNWNVPLNLLSVISGREDEERFAGSI